MMTLFCVVLITRCAFAQTPAEDQSGIDVKYPDGSSQHFMLNPSANGKDVYVFVEWFNGYKHSHKPIASTVVSSDNAPVETEPLGRAIQEFSKHGIKLHVFVAQYGIPETPQMLALGTTTPDGKTYDWSAFDRLKSMVQFTGPPQVLSLLHFCLFAHQLGGVGLTNVSGLAKSIPGNDFIVSLGYSLNADFEVGTFMHELGHDLNLHHGGVDDLNSKPNYPSIMNYLYQFSGTWRDGVPGLFAYSDVALSIDETHLIDKEGISADPALRSYGGVHLCMGTPVPIYSFNDPVRWDCKDADPDSTGQVEKLDVNADGVLGKLNGIDDWTQIVLTPSAGIGIIPTAEPQTDVLQGQLIELAPSVTASLSGRNVTIAWKRLPLDVVKGYVVSRQSEGTSQPTVVYTASSDTGSFSEAAPVSGVLSYTVRTVLVFETASNSSPPIGLSPNQLLAEQLEAKNTYLAIANQLPTAPDAAAVAEEGTSTGERLDKADVRLMASSVAGLNISSSTLGAPSTAVRVIIP